MINFPLSLPWTVLVQPVYFNFLQERKSKIAEGLLFRAGNSSMRSKPPVTPDTGSTVF